MLTLIDRFIARSYLTFFAAGLVVFVTIFLAVDFMSSFMRYDVTIDVLGRYYMYFIPGIMYQMVPVACLLATIFTLSSLNKSNELVAMFSLGLSLARISTPILCLVGLISVMTFWVGDRALPVFAQKKNYVYYVELKKKPSLYSTVKTNRIWYRSENILFNIQTLDAERSEARGLTLYYFDREWNLVQLIRSQEVSMNGNMWDLAKGTVTLFAEESSFPLTKSFNKKTLTMGEDIADIKSTAHSADIMSLNQLRKFIRKNKEAGLQTLTYEVDYLGKFSFAFAGLVMCLMGIPFSLWGQRSGGGLLNVALCMGLAFGYWVMYSSSLSLGRHGLVPAIVAAWGPNLLMIGLSVYFLLRLKR